MAAYLGAIFVASLLGSLHCAGMCGGLVAVAVTPTGPRSAAGNLLLTTLTRLHAAYHLGRLLSYAGLGAVAGALGEVLRRGGALAGYQHTAALVAGSLLIVLAALGLLHALGIQTWRPGHSTALTAFLARVQRTAAAWPAVPRSATIGALSALLPCGWLYMFVLAAAGTASVWAGSLTMAAFWAGSVPVLLGVGVGAQALRATVGRHVPVLMSLVLLVLGVWTVWGRATLPSFTSGDAAPPATLTAPNPNDVPPCCHDHER